MAINNEIETCLVPPERRLNQVCQFSVPNTYLFCILISFKLVYIYTYHVFIWFFEANKNGSVSTVVVKLFWPWNSSHSSSFPPQHLVLSQHYVDTALITINDGTNDASRLSDDPGISGTSAPTTFIGQAVPAIPALNNWAMLLLLSLLGVAAAWRLREVMASE